MARKSATKIKISKKKKDGGNTSPINNISAEIIPQEEITKPSQEIVVEENKETEVNFLDQMEVEYPLAVKGFKSIIEKVLHTHTISDTLASAEGVEYLKRFTGMKKLPKNGSLQKALQNSFSLKESELKEFAL